MSYISDKRWSEAVREIEPFTLEGHDRDCAKAMLSQSILTGRVSPLSEVQVKHLLWIGYSAGREAAVADLRDRGLLVEPGSETRPEHSHLRIEYAVQVPDEASVRAITLIRRYAMQILDDLRTSFPDAYLVTRHHIVHDEPWQPVDASGDTP